QPDAVLGPVKADAGPAEGGGVNGENHGRTVASAHLYRRGKIAGKVNVVPSHLQKAAPADRFHVAAAGPVIEYRWRFDLGQLQVYRDAVPLVGPDAVGGRIDGKTLLIRGR